MPSSPATSVRLKFFNKSSVLTTRICSTPKKVCIFKSSQQFHFTVSYIIYLSKTIYKEMKEVRTEQKVSFCKKLTNLCPNLFCTFHYLYALFISPTKRCKKVFNNEMMRSEEHTSELQSRGHLVCRLLLEKKKINRVNKLY